MPPRLTLPEKAQSIRSIYDDGSGPIEFISSGCTTLDKALGGGWVIGRVANIIGDKSTGKTLLAWEAIAQFVMAYPKGKARYREIEEAFDKSYMAYMGMPIDRVEFNEDKGGNKLVRTVEDMMDDIIDITKSKPKEPSLYIVDSLDALSSRAEMDRKPGESSYGAERAKGMSEFFRKYNGAIADAKITPIFISQIRDRIGVTFGRKWDRSGGHALDFYATHIVVLAYLGQITKQRNKIKRAIGVEVRAKVEKNKIGMPFREAQFPIIFGYGIDDEISSLNWLDDAGIEVPKGISPEELKELVSETWDEVEATFAPIKRKY